MTTSNSVLNVLSSLSCLDAFQVASNQNDRDIKAWVAQGEYVPTMTGNTLTLHAITRPDLTIAISNDILRNGYAFIETLQNARAAEDRNNTAPWVTVILYYAAFFSAQTFLRIFARSCSYLDGPVISNLNRTVRQHLGSSIKSWNSGLYYLDLRDPDRVSLASMKDPHKATWKACIELIDNLADEVTASPFATVDKTETVAHLLNLHDCLAFNTQRSPSSMSEFRNSINYRYSHQVWHPSTRNADRLLLKSQEGIRLICAGHPLTHNPTDEIEKFIAAVFALSRLVIDLVEFNCDRIGANATKTLKLKGRLLQVMQ